MNCIRVGLRGVLCLILVLACLASASGAAEEGKKAKGEFGIMIGSLGGMNVELTRKDDGARESDLETEAGLSVGLFFEQKSFFGLWAGVSLDYYDVQTRAMQLMDSDPRSLGLALRLSGRLTSTDGRWILRPGISSGALLFGEVGYLKTSQHVSIKPFLEVVHRASPKIGLVGELGIFSTVWGANDDYDIIAGPTTLLRLGILVM